MISLANKFAIATHISSSTFAKFGNDISVSIFIQHLLGR